MSLPAEPLIERGWHPTALIVADARVRHDGAWYR
jgi:hypothetical protein